MSRATDCYESLFRMPVVYGYTSDGQSIISNVTKLLPFIGPCANPYGMRETVSSASGDELIRVGSTWTFARERSQHLADISSLYGPGAVGCWLLIVCSVVVSWTVNKSIRSKDCITNDFIAALTMPFIAAVHTIDQVTKFPVELQRMFVYCNYIVGDRESAAIEASLSICQTFAGIALLLAAISIYSRQAKRFFLTAVVGLFCYGLQVALTFLAPVPSPALVSRSRTAPLQNLIVTGIITSALGVVLVAVAYVWLDIATSKRRAGQAASRRSTDIALTNVRSQHSQARAQNDEEADTYTNNERLTHLSKRVSALIVIFLPASFIVFMLEALSAEPINQWYTYAWRLRFFIPEGNVSVDEMDQAAALVGGAFTLAFSCYDAYRSWVEDKGK